MKLYLVRHGLTEENAARVIQGWNPGKLSTLGIEQAEKLAERLKDIQFNAIYSSDSTRAADTARIIARYHEAPINFTAALRERHMGIFQGGPALEFEQAQTLSGLSPADFTPEGGESLEELSHRAMSFVQGLRDQYWQQTILLVAHGRLNSMLLAAASRLKPEDALTIKQTNTCVNILECDQRGCLSILLLNCAVHLTDGNSHSMVTSGENS
ncbi:MAG: histidine phosphatase family protein [Blastocatellia bacterium]